MSLTECQDTSHAQYVLVRELVGHVPAACPRQLCVVGDADQSYAFTAPPSNIEDFGRDYPEAAHSEP